MTAIFSKVIAGIRALKKFEKIFFRNKEFLSKLYYFATFEVRFDKIA